MKDILQEALDIQKMDGDAALLMWYNSLPPERQAEFMLQMTKCVGHIQVAFDALLPVLSNFVQAIVDWGQKMGAIFEEAMNARPTSSG